MTTIRETIGGALFATSFNGAGSGLTGVPRLGVAVGTANHILVNDGSGALSSTALLNAARGGTGIDTSSSLGFPYIDGGAWSVVAKISNVDIDAGAQISRSKLATGTANHVIINSGLGIMTSEAQLTPLRGGTGQDFSGVGAGPFITTISSGVFSSTLTYSQTAGANTIVQRDGSGNVVAATLTASTIAATGDLTITPAGGDVLFGTAVINQTPTTVANGNSASYTANVTTSNATPTTIISIPTASGTKGTVYSIRCLIALGDNTGGANTGLFNVHFKAENLLGTVGVSTALQSGSVLDGTLSTTDITITTSGTNILVQVTGLAATTINWCGGFDVVSQQF